MAFLNSSFSFDADSRIFSSFFLSCSARSNARSSPAIRASNSSIVAALTGAADKNINIPNPVSILTIMSVKVPGTQADCFRSSKYSRVTLNTIGASNNKPTRLGMAIRPFKVSDRFQTNSTFTLAKPNAAAIHNTR